VAFENIWDSISQAIPEGEEYNFIKSKIKADLSVVDDEVFRDLAS
jgi:hypothetical protein